jgi:Na+-transporting methylmalonyl-CoA/oxaloacetate decarboxylase gamma subunit
MQTDAVMNLPFSAEAMQTFFSGLRVMAFGMSLVLGVLFLFYILIRLMIKAFPEKD